MSPSGEMKHGIVDFLILRYNNIISTLTHIYRLYEMCIMAGDSLVRHSLRDPKIAGLNPALGYLDAPFRKEI